MDNKEDQNNINSKNMNWSSKPDHISRYYKLYNKTLKSYLFAIIGAEYVLRWLPIGTHEWEKFVKPEELKRILIKNKLNLKKIDGMNFNLIKNKWSVGNDKSVNYIAKFIKN